MQQVWNWIVARASEGTTWAGIAAGATATAVALQAHQPLYVAVLAGLAAVVIPEAKK